MNIGNTNIPRSPFLDTTTNRVSREWLLYLLGLGTSMSYGAFHDETTQTAAANTATAITFSNTDYTNNVYIGSPTSRIYFNKAGIYSVAFSIQTENTATAVDDITLWFKINGVDVPTSSGIFGTVGKHGSINGKGLFGWTAFYSFNAGDYLQMYWATTGGHTSLTTYPIGVAPVHPLSPSVAININFFAGL